LAANFKAWVDAVETCLRASRELPSGADLRALAEMALNVMEGGVMQARTFRDIAHFDRAIAQFRRHIGHHSKEPHEA
jgi:hypothetical protein